MHEKVITIESGDQDV